MPRQFAALAQHRIHSGRRQPGKQPARDAQGPGRRPARRILGTNGILPLSARHLGLKPDPRRIGKQLRAPEKQASVRTDQLISANGEFEAPLFETVEHRFFEGMHVDDRRHQAQIITFRENRDPVDQRRPSLHQLHRPGQHALAGFDRLPDPRPLVRALAVVAVQDAFIARQRIDVGDPVADGDRQVAHMAPESVNLLHDAFEVLRADPIMARHQIADQAAAQEQHRIELAVHPGAQLGGQGQRHGMLLRHFLGFAQAEDRLARKHNRREHQHGDAPGESGAHRTFAPRPPGIAFPDERRIAFHTACMPFLGYHAYLPEVPTLTPRTWMTAAACL